MLGHSLRSRLFTGNESDQARKHDSSRCDRVNVDIGWQTSDDEERPSLDCFDQQKRKFDAQRKPRPENRDERPGPVGEEPPDFTTNVMRAM
jgi:hypothetical protein